MTPTPAGRSQSSRVKSFRSLEPNSSELLNYSGWWISSLRFFRFLRGGLLLDEKCQFFFSPSEYKNPNEDYSSAYVSSLDFFRMAHNPLGSEVFKILFLQDFVP